MSVPRLLDLQTGSQAIIDAADWPIVQDLTVYEGTNGYAYFSVWVDGASHPQTLHSLLVDSPPGSHVNHINGSKLDNRRENLRVVTPQRNQVNRKNLNRNNTSGIRGVAYRPDMSRTKPWHAQIGVNGTTRYIGLFPTQSDAIQARQEAELQYFGELCP